MIRRPDPDQSWQGVVADSRILGIGKRTVTTFGPMILGIGKRTVTTFGPMILGVGKCTVTTFGPGRIRAVGIGFFWSIGYSSCGIAAAISLNAVEI